MCTNRPWRNHYDHPLRSSASGASGSDAIAYPSGDSATRPVSSTSSVLRVTCCAVPSTTELRDACRDVRDPACCVGIRAAPCVVGYGEPSASIRPPGEYDGVGIIAAG
jgi:hypothetical protein